MELGFEGCVEVHQVTERKKSLPGTGNSTGECTKVRRHVVHLGRAEWFTEAGGERGEA